jgi:hypothetical protein
MLLSVQFGNGEIQGLSLFIDFSRERIHYDIM